MSNFSLLKKSQLLNESDTTQHALSIKEIKIKLMNVHGKKTYMKKQNGAYNSGGQIRACTTLSC